MIAAEYIENSHFIWREDAEALREVRYLDSSSAGSCFDDLPQKIALAVDYYSDETHRANDLYMNLEQVIAAVESRM